MYVKHIFNFQSLNQKSLVVPFWQLLQIFTQFVMSVQFLFSVLMSACITQWLRIITCFAEIFSLRPVCFQWNTVRKVSHSQFCSCWKIRIYHSSTKMYSNSIDFVTEAWVFSIQKYATIHWMLVYFLKYNLYHSFYYLQYTILSYWIYNPEFTLFFYS